MKKTSPLNNGLFGLLTILAFEDLRLQRSGLHEFLCLGILTGSAGCCAGIELGLFFSPLNVPGLPSVPSLLKWSSRRLASRPQCTPSPRCALRSVSVSAHFFVSFLVSALSRILPPLCLYISQPSQGTSWTSQRRPAWPIVSIDSWT